MNSNEFYKTEKQTPGGHSRPENLDSVEEIQ